MDLTLFKIQRTHWILAALLFILLMLGIHVLISIFLPISKDEAYYWAWSQRLDLGYFDHPPMVAWLIALGTAIGGNSALGVRLGVLLASILISVSIYQLTGRLFNDKRAAFLSVFILNLLPLFSVGSVIISPDTPLMLGWSLAMQCIWLAYEKGKIWWIMCGVALGFAMLSKLTAILFMPCALIWLISNAKGRQWLMTPWPYCSCLIAIFIFSPFIIWNANHEWVSFLFQLKHGLSERNGGLYTLATYFGGQLLVATPILFAIYLLFCMQTLRGGFSSFKPAKLFLICFSAPLFIFFIISSLRGPVEANWTSPAYFAVAAALGKTWSDALTKKGPCTLGKWFLFASIYSGITISILCVLAIFPSITLIFPRNRIVNEFLGWADLASTVKEHLQGSGSKVYRVMAPSYQIASQLAFYGINLDQIEVVRYPNSRFSQYDIWGSSSKKAGDNALYISESHSPIHAHIRDQFQFEEPLKEIPLVYQGKAIRSMRLIKFSNYQELKGSEPSIIWSRQKIGIVIPTYNERDNLPLILAELRKYLPNAWILIVDDSSPDGTGILALQEAAKDPLIEVYHRPNKLGLGTAYLEGFQKALKNDCDVIVQMDSDFSHHPAEVNRLIEELADVDLVLGSRYVIGGSTSNRGILRECISFLGSAYAGAFLGIPYCDLTGGFKAWRATALKSLLSDEILSKGFAFQLEMTYRSHRAGLRIREIPIHFKNRQLGQSKMSIQIAFEALYVCYWLRWNIPQKMEACSSD